MIDIGATALLLTASSAHQGTPWYATWWVSASAAVAASAVTAAIPALRGVISGLFHRNSHSNTVIIRSGRDVTVLDADRVQASDIARIISDLERKRSDSGGDA